MQKESVKKVLHIANVVISWILVALAILMMVFTIVSVNTFDRNDRSIFGYKAFIVQSDSMKATDFAAGDLIFSKEVDVSTLVEGDIITFQSLDPDSYGEIITHKIRSIVTDANGNRAFVTYGTTTGTDDETEVTASFILGKYQFCIPGVGTFFTFLKTTPGYIICILIPFMLLILLQGYNCIKIFRKYKAEQMADIEEERRQMAEKQKELDEKLAMMQQMMQMQQMGQAPVQLAASPDVPAEALAEASANTPAEEHNTPEGQA